jgi:hypothetical protein
VRGPLRLNAFCNIFRCPTPAATSIQTHPTKDTTFGESKILEFRLETFNTFSRPQFFGANTVDRNINDSTFGRVVSAMSPRLMQVSVKYSF